ncbi:MAG TPA: UDP-3-O-acyl-N-acetylglucosamine deacetylase [Fimbriimonadaceae bacterium]
MKFERKTLGRKTLFSGKGLHSGEPVSVMIHPSEEGIRFRYGSDSWTATADNVTDTTRCTRLGSISTVEHLMSALAGLEVTDAEIEVTAPELPAMDGSSRPYYDGLLASGFTSLEGAELPDPFSRIFVQEGQASIGISLGSGRWRYEFHTGERWPGSQIFASSCILEDYARVANARTFGFEEELPMIAAAGLAKGLDETSALVLGKDGFLNEARSEDEPVLHKMLDMIGDLYLSGYPIRFLNVAATRTGHTANVKAAKLLREQALAGTDRG